jgi:hypothetical protein
MKHSKNKKLDFLIDKLTSSIENTLTGEIFETDIIKLGEENIALIKKSEWQFDWRLELKKPDREVYGLTTRENPNILHGIVSFSDNNDHIFMHLIESAKFNRSAGKLYVGVPGNLVAFVCKKSFEHGFRGVIAFVAKTALFEHYEKSLKAKRFTRNRMFINTREAHELVTKYFKDFDNA